MDPAFGLHTAVRRYCTDRIARWSLAYSQARAGRRSEATYSYTEQDYDLFPRYLVLGAIEIEVARIDPFRLPNFPDAVAQLLRAIEMASNPFTRLDNPVAQAAMAQERRRLKEYVIGLSEGECTAIPRLPYRRVLAPIESNDLRARLRAEWGANVSEYWYPVGAAKRDRAEAVQASWLLHDVTAEK